LPDLGASIPRLTSRAGFGLERMPFPDLHVTKFVNKAASVWRFKENILVSIAAAKDYWLQITAWIFQ
jgi:hypothetical protein